MIFDLIKFTKTIAISANNNKEGNVINAVIKKDVVFDLIRTFNNLPDNISKALYLAVI